MKKYVIAFLTLIFSLSAYSLSFTIESSTRLLNGNTCEYVIVEDKGTDKLLSRINWNMTNLVIQEIGLGFEWHNLSLNAAFSAGLPKSSGSTIDRDWIDYKVNNLYSKSDNHLDFYFDYCADIGYSFLWKELEFRPFFSVGYKNYKFTGSDGYCMYSPLGVSYKAAKKADLEGDIFDYKIASIYTWLGFDFNIHHKNWTVCSSGALMPYQITNCFDSHLLRNLDFFDETEGTFCGAKASVGVKYAFTRLISIKSEVEGVTLFRITGDTYSKNSSDSEYERSKNSIGGYSTNHLSFDLGICLNLF